MWAASFSGHWKLPDSFQGQPHLEPIAVVKSADVSKLKGRGNILEDNFVLVVNHPMLCFNVGGHTNLLKKHGVYHCFYPVFAL